jgi:hypothetical protein
VTHSEFNPSKENKVHFLQIWILPEEKDLPPSYQELDLKTVKNKDGLILVGSSDEKAGVIKIYQDVKMYLGRLKKNQDVHYSKESRRGVWIQMVRGRVTIQDKYHLETGDGISIEDSDSVSVLAATEAEFLFFDLM